MESSLGLEDPFQHSSNVFPILAPSLFSKFKSTFIVFDVFENLARLQESLAFRKTLVGEAVVVEVEDIEYLD